MDKIELLNKIKALSEKGIGGEAENAKEILARLMDKFGITEEDISREENKDYFFKVSGINNRILVQVVKCVNRSIKIYDLPKKTVREFGLDGNFMIECTPAEFIQISQMYDLYSKLYQDELEVFFLAFLKSNDLLIRAPKDEMRSFDDLSEKEKEEYIRMSKIAQNIRKESIVKRIESA